MMKKTKIALVKAAWHQEIVDQAEKGFLEALDSDCVVETYIVPGCLEMPLMCKKLAETGEYAAIACAGFVTDGGIYRHEFVAHAILQGFTNVQLQTGVPVLSAVLTPKETFAEDGSNPEQYDFYFNHMVTKGEELAQATMATVENMERFE